MRLKPKKYCIFAKVFFRISYSIKYLKCYCRSWSARMKSGFLVSAATRSLLCRNSGFGSHITQQSVEPPTVVAFLIPRVVYHQHIPI